MSHLIIFQDITGSYLYDGDRLIGMGLASKKLKGYVFAFVSIGSFEGLISNALKKYKS